MTFYLWFCQLRSEANCHHRSWCIITIEILIIYLSLSFINFKYKCTKLIIFYFQFLAWFDWQLEFQSKFPVPGLPKSRTEQGVYVRLYVCGVRVCSYARILAFLSQWSLICGELRYSTQGWTVYSIKSPSDFSGVSVGYRKGTDFCDQYFFPWKYNKWYFRSMVSFLVWSLNTGMVADMHIFHQKRPQKTLNNNFVLSLLQKNSQS
jgi:hypothetical protein